MGAIAIFIVSCFFIQAFSGVFWMVVGVLMVDINLLASVQYWAWILTAWNSMLEMMGMSGANFSNGYTPPGVVNMVMAVGLVVDFSAHIVHTYYDVKEGS